MLPRDLRPNLNLPPRPPNAQPPSQTSRSPGLVFPSFLQTREEMVVNGILPIDQLREHTSPVRLICQRIPRRVLVETYGIRLAAPGPGQAAGRQPTVAELLDAFCAMRGFHGSTHSGFDHPRGARTLLKDYCEGKIAYCHPPPGGWGLVAPPPAPAAAAAAAARAALYSVRARVAASVMSFSDLALRGQRAGCGWMCEGPLATTEVSTRSGALPRSTRTHRASCGVGSLGAIVVALKTARSSAAAAVSHVILVASDWFSFVATSSSRRAPSCRWCGVVTGTCPPPAATAAAAAAAAASPPSSSEDSAVSMRIWTATESASFRFLELAARGATRRHVMRVVHMRGSSLPSRARRLTHPREGLGAAALEPART